MNEIGTDQLSVIKWKANAALSVQKLINFSQPDPKAKYTMIESKVGTYQLLLKGKKIPYKELGIERWKKMAIKA
jgi:hypothetical protein